MTQEQEDRLAEFLASFNGEGQRGWDYIEKELPIALSECIKNELRSNQYDP